MSYLTIRLSDGQIKRLKQLAADRRVSMSGLFEELSSRALAEFDVNRAPGVGVPVKEALLLEHKK